MWLSLLLAVLSLAVLGALVWWLVLSDPGAGGPRVLNREAASGVVDELVAFLDWWEKHGPFAIVVAGPDAKWPWVPPGGVRSTPEDQAAQAKAFATGLSHARNLAETPHGHRGALDAWPAEFDPRIAWDKQPTVVKAKFATYGALGEAHGLKWGGRWVNFGKGKSGDQPHLEVKGWQKLPMASGYGGNV